MNLDKLRSDVVEDKYHRAMIETIFHNSYLYRETIVEVNGMSDDEVIAYSQHNGLISDKQLVAELRICLEKFMSSYSVYGQEYLAIDKIKEIASDLEQQQKFYREDY